MSENLRVRWCSLFYEKPDHTPQPDQRPYYLKNDKGNKVNQHGGITGNPCTNEIQKRIDKRVGFYDFK